MSEKEKEINQVVVGDIQITSSKTNVKDLKKVCKEIIKDKIFNTYLTSFEKKKIISTNMFG